MALYSRQRVMLPDPQTTPYAQNTPFRADRPFCMQEMHLRVAQDAFSGTADDPPYADFIWSQKGPFPAITVDVGLSSSVSAVVCGSEGE